ncbi:DUF4360 domain-containing protein [Glycomyces harbinensis]|uniref:DUF4360 domain-containing protein n=1 Tax=Glycomyces harbinensis TaxID=58114 RepID=A0A1G7ARK6_9ACTN|nr:DUF4360 domain-containing protein [Glycomyces harbinensis]SDE16635.1 protein of unknown function [Glycomyces harbinensis]
MRALRKFPLLAGVVSLAAVMLAGPAQADAVPADAPGGKVTVEVATVNGSGCPQGTASVAVGPGNTSFTVVYSRFLAEAGGGADAVDSRKNCQINLEVNIPSGYTYAIAKAEYRGFGHLERGATGLQQASYYFTGSSQTTSSAHELEGPYNGTWRFADQAAVDELVYKPCGEQRNFNINAELRVGAGDDAALTSFMAMDSTKASIETVYHFAWKRCT